MSRTSDVANQPVRYRAAIKQDVPKGALSVRMTDRARKRLERLQRVRDSSYAQVINDALIHMLATYERKQEIFSYVPSEQAEADSPAEKPEAGER